MLTDTELSNMAISHLGSGKEITDLATERSQEAAACRRFYDTAREQVLRDFAWPFATRYTVLTLVTDYTGVEGAEWRYAYAWPTRCLVLRKVYSGYRRDIASSVVPFTISSDASGKLILTDMPLARVEYTLDVTDDSVVSSDFDMAFSFLLAHLIAPRLTGGDPFKRGQATLSLYFQWLSTARANALNEVQAGEDYDSEFIRARDE